MTTNERACNFKPHEIPGLLDGSKTQFRRVMGPQPQYMQAVYMGKGKPSKPGYAWPPTAPFWKTMEEHAKAAPLGRAGDVIWGREAFWARNDTCDHEYCSGCDMGSMLSLGKEYAEIDYVATPRCSTLPIAGLNETVIPWVEEPLPGDWQFIPADDFSSETNDQVFFSPFQYATKYSSAQMPRWASRITLEIVSVRVERLQEISHDDAVSEGAGRYPHSMSVQKRFRLDLWDPYAKPGEDWDANPWVWVYEIKTQKAGNQ